MKHGFVKVAAAVPFVSIADCWYNVERIERMIFEAEAQGVEIMTFPELSITGYSCGDLFLQPFLLEEAERALLRLVERTRECKVMVIVGMPIRVEEQLFNAALAFQSGKMLGAIPKTYLPNYREFQEVRWFSPARELQFTLVKIGEHEVPIGHNVIFRSGELAVGIEICEDVWTPYTPGTRLALYGAQIIFNLSASNESVGKHSYLRSLISGISSQDLSGYVYCSAGYGESSTDLVYCGKAFIAEVGQIVEEMPRFEMTERLLINDLDVSRISNERLTNSSFKSSIADHTQRGLLTEIPFALRSEEESKPITRKIERHPFMPEGEGRDLRCRETFDIQVCALVQRLKFMQAQHAIIGVSGGLDSTLALLVTVGAFDFLGLPRKQIIAVTMPGLGTSSHTQTNAHQLMQLLGVTEREIDIRQAALEHLRMIGHDATTQDLTYENAQARERTQILMDLANMYHGPVIGTGDMSELALGWCTFNGDHMSMYGVNAGVSKTTIQMVVDYISREELFGSEIRAVLHSILETPISPELKKDAKEEISQSTEAIIGPYELHDFILYHFLGNGYKPRKIHYLASVAFEGKYTPEEIKRTMAIFFKRFFSQQYKRNSLPDGPKVSKVSLSPRGTLRLPSDMSASMWLKEVELLPERYEL